MRNRIKLFGILFFFFGNFGCGSSTGLPIGGLDEMAERKRFNLRVGEPCEVWSDCASGICQDTGQGSFACAPAPTCSNGMQDGVETDVDCGGPACRSCLDGRLCASPKDCLNRACDRGRCVPNPNLPDLVSLPDLTQPSDLAAVDMSVVPDLASSPDLTTSPDLVSTPDLASSPDLVSTPDLTALPDLTVLPDLTTIADLTTPRDLTSPPDLAPMCVVDGVKNGAETDVDCGGGCTPCVVAKSCNVNSDCKSGACDVNLCRLAYTTGIVDPMSFPPLCPMGTTVGFLGWDNAGNPVTNGPPLVMKPGLGWGPHVMIAVTCNGALVNKDALKPFCGRTAQQLGVKMTRDDGTDISATAQVCVDPFSVGYKFVAYAQGATPCPSNPACP